MDRVNHRSRRWRGAARARGFLLTLGTAALSGCYAHIPASPGAVAPSQRVRAHLTPEAAERTAAVLGTRRSAVDGVVLHSTADEIAILVPAAYVQAGLGTEALRQELRYEWRELVAVERRELDRVRTGALAGLGAVVVGALFYRIFSGESGGSTNPPPGGGGTEARIPAWPGR